MDRVNTAIWENNKFEHNHCLCYSEAKGLYVARVPLAPKEDVLFLSHNHNGFWKKQVSLTKENLTIQVERNFGYGIRTYMRELSLREMDKDCWILINPKCTFLTIVASRH